MCSLECHCERSEAISAFQRDCFVASLLAMTEPDEFSDTLQATAYYNIILVDLQTLGETLEAEG